MRARNDPKVMVPVQLVIDFDLLDAGKPLAGVLTPSLEPVGGKRDAAAPPAEYIRMAQQFSSPDNVTDPHRGIVNDMCATLSPCTECVVTSPAGTSFWTR